MKNGKERAKPFVTVRTVNCSNERFNDSSPFDYERFRTVFERYNGWPEKNRTGLKPSRSVPYRPVPSDRWPKTDQAYSELMKMAPLDKA